MARPDFRAVAARRLSEDRELSPAIVSLLSSENAGRSTGVKVINMIRMKLNRDLKILGLLPTFYDSRTNLARDMLDELRVVGDHHVFQSIVRSTVKLGEAPLVGRPITVYAGNTDAARTYRELAREVVDLGSN